MHHLRTVGVMALAAGSIVLPVRAQDPVAAARDHVAEHRAEIVLELRDFLTIPNVALDSDNIRRNATALVAMMERRGITTRILETGGPPVVYGEIGDPDLPTVLFYCHYDGQPADPSQWEQGAPDRIHRGRRRGPGILARNRG